MSGATSGLLERMARASRARVRAARTAAPEARVLARAAATAPAPPLTLGAFDLIAELKLRSPSAGGLARQGLDRGAQIAAYCEGGAAAISVLTEPDEFGGSLDHLRDAAALAAPHGRPVMRKDFLTDPYQVAEARAAGAGGVLIIVTMLTDAEVGALLDAARELGLFALLEAFDAEDLERIAALDVASTDIAAPDFAAPDFAASDFAASDFAASDIAGLDAMARGGGGSDAGAPDVRAASPPVLAGLNCRNLRTLDVDFDRFAALARHLPPGLPAVAESGIDVPDDARSVAAHGYRVALVGSALMRAPDPAVAVAELIAAGREAAAAPKRAERAHGA